MENKNCLYTEKIIVILNKMKLCSLDYFPYIQMFYGNFPLDYIENFTNFDDVWNSTNNIITKFFKKKRTWFSRKKYCKYKCNHDEWESIKLKKINKKNFQELKIIHVFSKIEILSRIEQKVYLKNLAIELPTEQFIKYVFIKYVKDNNIDYKNI